MKLELNEIHIWSVDLAAKPDLENENLALLSSDECERALRFRQPLHRCRFIAARTALRQVLGLYLAIPPQQISFGYTEHNKPFLRTPNNKSLQFNLAHSHDIAVIAVTLDHAVGIDIERVQNAYTQAVVDRYYHSQESKDLLQLPDEERITGFYRLWSRKEAVVKAIGMGLSISLPTFSVSVNDVSEAITLNGKSWSLVSLPIHPDYQSALATCQMIKKISYWRYFEHGSVLDKVSEPVVEPFVVPA